MPSYYPSKRDGELSTYGYFQVEGMLRQSPCDHETKIKITGREVTEELSCSAPGLSTLILC